MCCLLLEGMYLPAVFMPDGSLLAEHRSDGQVSPGVFQMHLLPRLTSSTEAMAPGGETLGIIMNMWHNVQRTFNISILPP